MKRSLVVGLLALALVASLAWAAYLAHQLRSARSTLADATRSANLHERESRYLMGALARQTSYLVSTVEPEERVLHGVFLARIADAASDGSLTFDWVTGESNGLGELPVIDNGSDATFTYPPAALGPAAFIVDDDYPKLATATRFVQVFNAPDARGRAMRDRHWWVTLSFGQYMVFPAQR